LEIAENATIAGITASVLYFAAHIAAFLAIRR
jgi:hypothetical protein